MKKNDQNENMPNKNTFFKRFDKRIEYIIESLLMESLKWYVYAVKKNFIRLKKIINTKKLLCLNASVQLM